MEPKASLPQSQVPATCPYFESTASRVPRANACLNWYKVIKICLQSKLFSIHLNSNILTFNSNRSPTRRNNFPVSYPDVYLQPARPRTQSGYHHDTKLKPEAATQVVELLMMGGRTPETCWAVNKRQDNKLENFCVWLVIYLNCTIVHGLITLKFYHSVVPITRGHKQQLKI
jgi:hypothetical protein